MNKLPKISKPPATPIQFLLEKRGLPFYKGEDGIWKAPDNSVRKEQLREIQTGRYYAFTGVETITFPSTVTTIIGTYYNGSSWIENTDLSSFLSGSVLTPDNNISYILVNSSDVYNCDESSGTVAYDASGNDNHADISLGGTAESNFHQTSNLVSSIQNESGYGQALHFTGSNYGTVAYDATMTTDYVECEIKFKIGSIGANQALYAHQYGNSGGGDSTIEAGFAVRVNAVGALKWVYARNNPSVMGTYGTYTIAPGVVYTANIRHFNPSSGNGLIITVDGIIRDQKANTGAVYDKAAYDSRVGCELIGNPPVNGNYTRDGGEVYYVKVWNLDAEGNRTSMIVDYNPQYGNDAGVINLAPDAAENTSIVWPSTPSYAYIPRSLSTPLEDVLGNSLLRSHRGRVRYDGNIVKSSVANFDGNLYGDVGNPSSLGGIPFSVYIKFKSRNNTKSIITKGSSRTSMRDWGLFGNGTSLVFAVFSISGNSKSASTLYPSLDEWHEVLAVYDGTNINLYLNSELKGSNTQSSVRNLYDLHVGGYNSYIFDGELSDFKFWNSVKNWSGINDASEIYYKFSETSGLKWYNTALNRPPNTDCDIILDGSADGTQWATDDLQRPNNLLDGFNNKEMIWPGPPVLGMFGYHPEFQVQNFEINQRIMISDNSYHRRTLVVAYETEVGYRGGILFFHRNATGFELVIAIDSDTAANYNTGIIPVNGTWYDIVFKKIGTAITWDINGTTGSFTATTANVQYSSRNTPTTIGAVYTGGFIPNSLLAMMGAIEYLKFYELDGSGARIKELINISKFGNKIQVPNLGSDAPENSDMVWLNGEGTYNTKIPHDPANPNHDVEGDAVVNKGGLPVHNYAESDILMNPNDAPELVAVGIDNTEVV